MMAYGGPSSSNTAATANNMFGISSYPPEYMDPSGLIRRMMLGGSAFGGGGVPHSYHSHQHHPIVAPGNQSLFSRNHPQSMGP